MKIKIFFKRNLKLILAISIPLVILLILMISSLFNSWWHLWPKNIRANIALNRLAISVYQEPICRNECFYQQLRFQQEIKSSINSKKLNKKLRKIIFNPEDNLAWRMMTLDLIKQSQDENSYLNVFLEEAQDYLDQTDVNLDLELKQYLLFSFYQQLDEANYLDNLKSALDKNLLNQDDLINSIKFLSSLDIFLPDLYLDLLSNSSLKVKKEILSSLGSSDFRFEMNRDEICLILTNVFLDIKSDFETRRLVIFILSDFIENKNNQKIFTLLDNFYQSEGVDKFSKYLLVEILNNNFSGNYQFPEISEKEWQNYYF